jgi:hypothetical protein
MYVFYLFSDVVAAVAAVVAAIVAAVAVVAIVVYAARSKWCLSYYISPKKILFIAVFY